MGEQRGRIVEWEFDLPRMVVLGGAIIILLVAAFFAGRMSAERQVRSVAPGVRQAASVATEGRFAAGRGSIFDEADGGGAPRSLGRQVTAETSLGGAFEVDLGTAASRAAADSLRREASKAGLPAMVVGAGGGSYRVVAGPFTTRLEARKAADRLAKILKRDLTVVDEGR